MMITIDSDLIIAVGLLVIIQSFITGLLTAWSLLKIPFGHRRDVSIVYFTGSVFGILMPIFILMIFLKLR